MTNIDSRIEWGLCKKVWNVPGYYLLFYERDMFTILPKRAFGSKEQEEQFKAMAHRKISPELTQIFS